MALKKMNLEIPWFKKWFDENYLLLYSHRDCEDAEKQVQLIIHTFNPKKNAKILDLGCGDGRYLYLFNKRGFQTFGLDLSERLLRKGMEKYKNPNVILGDMRAIPGHFDIILSLFTSFGYFEIERENEKVLDSVSESLNKGGWFWLDFLNPTVVKKNLVKESITEFSQNLRVIEKRKIIKNHIIKDIIFVQDDVKKCYQESVYMYSRDVLENLFRKVGLNPLGCFGDYAGSEWSVNSERTIIYGKKQS